MAEREPLRKDQLKNFAQLMRDELDNLRMGSIPEPGPRKLRVPNEVLAGFTRNLTVLVEYTRGAEVLETYRRAFLIAAGLEEPVITVGSRTIRLLDQAGVNTQIRKK